jgi:hypothetical protein
MWFLFEYGNPGTGPFQQRGTIELNLEHVAVRQPWWKVALRLAAACLMILLGLVLVAPLIPLAPILAIAVALFVLLLYCIFAHYVRPEPNTDNMGWVGGMMNDPFQFNDNVNRGLFTLHCWLGPGRFVSAAVIDSLVTVGWLPERTVEQIAATRAEQAEEQRRGREHEILERVAERQAQRPFQGTVELASTRFLSAFAPPADRVE